jgi:hypothetical protein
MNRPLLCASKLQCATVAGILSSGAIVSSIAPRWSHAHEESQNVSHGRGCCCGTSLRHATSICGTTHKVRRQAAILFRRRVNRDFVTSADWRQLNPSRNSVLKVGRSTTKWICLDAPVFPPTIERWSEHCPANRHRAPKVQVNKWRHPGAGAAGGSTNLLSRMQASFCQSVLKRCVPLNESGSGHLPQR